MNKEKKRNEKNTHKQLENDGRHDSECSNAFHRVPWHRSFGFSCLEHLANGDRMENAALGHQTKWSGWQFHPISTCFQEKVRMGDVAPRHRSLVFRVQGVANWQATTRKGFERREMRDMQNFCT